jgi:hypothetical protein
MTDTKPRAPRNPNAPLRAAIALDRIRAILSDQEDRLAEARAAIVSADAGKIFDIVKRVTDPKEEADLYTMAKALKVFLPARDGRVIDGEFEDPGVDPAPPEVATTGDVPERLREPLPPERLAVGRKR